MPFPRDPLERHPRRLDVLLDPKLLYDRWIFAVGEKLPSVIPLRTSFDQGNQRVSAQELRAETIAAHSTVLRALGGLGADLMKNEDWKERLARLAEIDWSKQNSQWQNVCIVAHSVVSNRQARAATKAFIKNRLGMPLSEAEQRSIERSPVVQEAA